MKEIESHFNQTFSHWDIRLPEDAIKYRRRGKISEKGWAIWYLFGSDEKGEFLDFYAAHRMTDDSHVRIRADGQVESLPSIHTFRVCSKDPKEDARLEDEYYARNQQIAEMLEKKGFAIQGDEPSGVQINRLLHLEKIEE